MSIDVQEPQNLSEKVQTFRVDVQLHDLLKKPQAIRPSAPPPGTDVSEKLPDPLFPQRPELLTEAWLPEDHHGSPVNPYKRHWTATPSLPRHAGLDVSLFQVSAAAGRFPPDHRLPLYGVEVQSRLSTAFGWHCACSLVRRT